MSSPSRVNKQEENTPPVSNKTVSRTPLYMFRDGKYVELDVEEAESQLQLQQQQLLQQEEEHDSDPEHHHQQQPDDEEDGIYKDTPPAEKRFRLPAIIERPLHSCHQQNENREKRRLYLWLSSVAILVVIFSIMLGILVAHRNNNKTMNSSTATINNGNNDVTAIPPPPTATSPPTANYNDNISSNTIISTASLTIEELRVMCNDVDGKSNSMMMTSNLSEELLQRREDLAALLPDLPITLAHSCHATNLALLWLAAHIPQEDSLEEFQNRFILTTLYLATRGESWKSNDMWLNPDVQICQWKGVSCDEAGEEIIGLSLNNMHLNGTLPGEEMAQLLPNLEKLDLSINHLTGTIPVKLVTLPNIAELNLAFNRFTGTIPTEIFDQTQLENLYLADAGATLGTIPTTIGNLESLTHFLASKIHANGTLPSELGQCTSLKILDLSSNQLEGRLPSELGNLVSLKSLYMKENNDLKVAPEVCRLANLQSFDLKAECPAS